MLKFGLGLALALAVQTGARKTGGSIQLRTSCATGTSVREVKWLWRVRGGQESEETRVGDLVDDIDEDEEFGDEATEGGDEESVGEEEEVDEDGESGDEEIDREDEGEADEEAEGEAGEGDGGEDALEVGDDEEVEETEGSVAELSEADRQMSTPEGQGVGEVGADEEADQDHGPSAAALAALLVDKDTEHEGFEGKKRKKRREGPTSRVEAALMRTPAGRMTLAATIIQKELLKVFLPQLYMPIMAGVRMLKRNTYVLQRLGFVPDEREVMMERVMKRRRRKQGSQVVDDDDDAEDELSAEKLMPAPISRLSRVSAGFVLRHALVMEAGGEGHEGKGEVRPATGSSSGSTKPMFDISFSLGSKSSQGKADSVLGRSSAERLTQKRERTKGDDGGIVTKKSSKPSSSTWAGISSSLTNSLDFDLTEQARALTKSVSSLTSSLSKAVKQSAGTKKQKKPKSRRKLFDDDEDEDEEGVDSSGAGAEEGASAEGAGIPPRVKDKIGIPPRRVIAEAAQGDPAGKGGVTSRKAVDSDDEDDGDWLSALRKGKCSSEIKRSTPSPAPAPTTRRRSLFGDDGDDDGASSRPTFGTASKPSSSRASPSSSAQERIDDIRRKASSSWASMRGSGVSSGSTRSKGLPTVSSRRSSLFDRDDDEDEDD